MSGWGNETCPGTAPDGQRCVLAPGHDGNHMTTAQQRAKPLSENQGAALVVMGIIAIAVVAVVFFLAKQSLDSML